MGDVADTCIRTHSYKKRSLHPPLCLTSVSSQGAVAAADIPHHLRAKKAQSTPELYDSAKKERKEKETRQERHERHERERQEKKERRQSRRCGAQTYRRSDTGTHTYRSRNTDTLHTHTTLTRMRR